MTFSWSSYLSAWNVGYISSVNVKCNYRERQLRENVAYMMSAGAQLEQKCFKDDIGLPDYSTPALRVNN